MKRLYTLVISIVIALIVPSRSNGQTVVSVLNSDFVFSPYNWVSQGPGYGSQEMVTNEPGAYFSLRFAGSSTVTLNMDLLGTPPGGGVTSLIIQYRIGGTLYPKLTLNNVYPNLVLATGLDSGPHTLQVWFIAAAYDKNRWARTATLANGVMAPPQSLRISGVTLDTGAAALSPPPLRPKRILFLGDSITEGVKALPENDSTQTYAVTCAALLSAEYGIVGNAGQGWTHNTAPSTGVPLLGDAYTSYYDQTPRFQSGPAVPAPDYVFVNMGTNDWVYGVPQDDPGVTSAAFQWLVQMRAHFPTSRVFLIVPFGGFVRPALSTAFAEYRQAYPADARVTLIDLGSTAQTGITALGQGATDESFDGEHPNAATQLLLGYQLAAAVKTALGANDFDGDGHSDLLLQNTGANQIAGWFLNGPEVLNSAVVTDTPDSDYGIVGSVDFDGDGSPDILFQNRVTGQLAVWFMRGMTHTGGELLLQRPAAGWKAVGVGDFNGDSKPDIVFQNATTGQIVVWYMNGTVMVGGSALDTLPGAGYRVVGTADFNRDGQSDLLFQNDSSGILVVWYLNGVRFAGGDLVNARPAPGYLVEAIADFDGDGRPDVALRSGSGDIALWHLDGARVFRAESLPIRLDPAYRIAGPR